MRFFLLLVFPLLLNALEFKVATYNVENLFDTRIDGHEYDEYKPNNKHGWNEAMLQKKLSHIAQVIADINPDIIALEEVENKAVLEQLNHALGRKAFPYLFFPHKKERVSVETALMSRFPIEKTFSIALKDQARGIHKVTLSIDGKSLDVYLNHWPAYKEKEDERLMYAKTLHQYLLMEPKNREFILLGDFNSPYKEQKGHWGMGLVNFLQAGDKSAPLYNLWYEVPESQRYSHSYGKEKSSLDHIIISQTLQDGKNIDYKPSSMQTFVRPYMLDENGNPLRWQISNRGRGQHLGEGYSDHLPLFAIFQTIK